MLFAWTNLLLQISKGAYKMFLPRLHVCTDWCPRKSVFHTLQQCSETASGACTGKCFFSSALCKCPPLSSHTPFFGHEKGDFSGKIYHSVVLGIHSKNKLMLLESTVCIIFWLLSSTLCELFSIWKVNVCHSYRRQLLYCQSLWMHMRWILFSQLLIKLMLCPFIVYAKEHIRR
jgi:hypothetical protein